MIIFTKEILLTENGTVKEKRRAIEMERFILFMKANGRMIIKMDKEP